MGEVAGRGRETRPATGDPPVTSEVAQVAEVADPPGLDPLWDDDDGQAEPGEARPEDTIGGEENDPEPGDDDELWF